MKVNVPSMVDVVELGGQFDGVIERVRMPVCVEALR